MSLPDYLLEPFDANAGCTHEKDPDFEYIIHGLAYCGECYDVMSLEYDHAYGRYYD